MYLFISHVFIPMVYILYIYIYIYGAKKLSSNLFDVTMGSFDGAESCELVGSFLLHLITLKHGNKFGLYRDDGLGIISATPRQIELITKDLCALFNNHGLKLLSRLTRKS
jgi:hypothetical protein